MVLTWIVPCRSCPHCLRGEAQLCAHGYDHAYGASYAESSAGPVWPGMGVGSLAEETLLPAAAVVPVDKSLPLDLAALLGCGVTTGVGAVMRTAAVRPGESVLVIGCGGVGLAAIQGARLAGAAPIIAADRVAGQLPAAVVNGATDTIDAGEVDLVTAVKDLTGGAGVDHGIEVVGKPATIRAAYDATRRGGRVTLVGAAAITSGGVSRAVIDGRTGKTIQELVLFYAAAVFVAFHAGLVSMCRFSWQQRRFGSSANQFGRRCRSQFHPRDQCRAKGAHYLHRRGRTPGRRRAVRTVGAIRTSGASDMWSPHHPEPRPSGEDRIVLTAWAVDQSWSRSLSTRLTNLARCDPGQ